MERDMKRQGERKMGEGAKENDSLTIFASRMIMVCGQWATAHCVQGFENNAALYKWMY